MTEILHAATRIGDDPAVDRQTLLQLDEAANCGDHWRIVLTSGMGFFTDAYDLFIIGVAINLVASEWDIAGWQKSLVASVALLTSALGAIVFGRLADRIGRKRVYGYEVLVLAVGEIFPTRVRTTCHGIAAAAGKIGAFIGTYTLTALLPHVGLSRTSLLPAAVCLIGLLVTFLLPESKGLSLEEIAEEAPARSVVATLSV